MRLPPRLLALSLAACSKEKAPTSLEQKMESALMERLLAARGSDEGVILTDDTPRADTPDKPREGSRMVFVRGASFYVPLEGLKGVAAAAGDAGFALRLDYGQGGIEILDSSGPADDREFERLQKVGERLWEGFWGGFGAQFANEPGAKEALDGFTQRLEALDKQFGRRFDKPHLLRRFALQADAKRPPEDLDEAYRDCRLMRVKREMIAAMGGGPEPVAYAVAAGPTIGIRRGLPGKDPEVRSAFWGPDGMAVRAVVAGALPEPIVLEVMNSFRPFAESKAIARRIAARGGEPVDVALAAVSALHLDPSTESAVQFLRSLKPLQEQRRELAEGLATWLKAAGAKREQILAAAD
jgi:hypothetical protein